MLRRTVLGRRVDGAASIETCCGVTSLTPERASPQRLLDLARGHWAIENGLHWVRDVTFDEDRSQVRKGNAPQILAALRNTAIGLLRCAGAQQIAGTLRSLSSRSSEVLRLLGLPAPSLTAHPASGP